LGRRGSQWGGESEYSGITLGKNELGYVCFIMGFFFVRHGLAVWKMEKSKARRNQLLETAFFLWMIAWLFQKANSATSLGVFMLGLLIMYLLSRPWMNKRLIGTYAIGIVATGFLLESTLGIWELLAGLMGRKADLTGRVDIWNTVLQLQTSPVFGTGFESFWLGERIEKIWRIFWWKPNQAHNGYLETYLDLGLVGLFLLFVVLLATYWKCKRELLENSEVGGFKLACLAAIVVYNWTEAAYKGPSPVFFLFFIIALDYPRSQVDPAPGWGHAAPEEEAEVLVSA
jgi:O-antigen ligase